MKPRILALLLALSTFLFYTPAYADTTAADNFDSYTNAATLAGLNGGTGSWTGAWRSDASGNAVVDNTQVEQGTEAISTTNTAVADRFQSRPFTGITSGSYSWWVRRATTNDDFDFMVGVSTSNTNANSACILRFNAGGTLTQFYSNFTGASLGSYSANTWYLVAVKFDGTNCQWSVTTSATPSYRTAQLYEANAGGTIVWEGFHYSNNASGDAVYIDNIGPAPAVGSFNFWQFFDF